MTGLFDTRLRKGRAAPLNDFAERLSVHGDILRAATEVGAGRSTGYDMFKRLCDDLGPQSR